MIRSPRADHNDPLTEVKGLGAGQVVDGKRDMAETLSLDVQGARLPEPGTDEHALIPVPEKVVNRDRAAD